MIALIFSFLVLWTINAQAQARYASFPSPSMPMSVKTPYLNTWLQYGNGTGPGSVTPQFWANWNLGHTGLIRIDGQTFRWMGSAGSDIPPAKTITQYISPTRTILVMMAGPVQINVTWLSPIEPDDWVKQSFPFTYYYIDIATADRNPHNIQLYTDITGEWVAKDSSSAIMWKTETNPVVYHQIQTQNQQSMSEIDSMAGDVTIYLAAAKEFNLSWQSGANYTIPLASFTTDGKLDDSMDASFRSINAGYPVVSFAYDLSTITATNSSIVWGLGAVRDPVITYRDGTDVQLRSAPYRSKSSSMSDSINEFLKDFPNAVSRADVLDSKIMSDGLEISSDYANLLALCLRQVMAAVEITISKDKDGNWNETDVISFMKDTGTTSRINAVDHLYASFPALLYINSSLAGTLLKPLLDLQVGLGAYSAVGDIGLSFPVTWGNTTLDTSQIITNNGDMLFMPAAHAKKSGDTLLISTYYDMLKRWADFLVSHCLYPGTKYKTPNEKNYPNMSNLAFQGIVGIHAMSAIAEIIGRKDDMEMYSRNASYQLSEWQNLTFKGDHLITAYELPTSWSLMYYMYSAKMIGLQVDQDILDAQTRFYEQQASKASQFGFPYSTEISLVRSYWTLLTSATTTSTTARDIFIKQIHDRFFWNGTVDLPFPSTYDKDNGKSLGFPGGRAGPTLGASFAHLALNLPDKILTSSTNSTTTGIAPAQTPTSNTNGIPVGEKAKNKNTGAIIGAVLGGIFAFIALFTGAFFLYKGRNHHRVYFQKSKFLSDTPVASPISDDGWPDSRRRMAGGVVYNPMHVLPVSLGLREPEKSKASDVPVVAVPLPVSKSPLPAGYEGSRSTSNTSGSGSIPMGPVPMAKPPLPESYRRSVSASNSSSSGSVPPVVAVPVRKSPLPASYQGSSGASANSSSASGSNSSSAPISEVPMPPRATWRTELHMLRRELAEMRASVPPDRDPPVYYLGHGDNENR